MNFSYFHFSLKKLNFLPPKMTIFFFISHFSKLNPINKFRQRASDPQVQVPQINVDDPM